MVPSTSVESGTAAPSIERGGGDVVASGSASVWDRIRSRTETLLQIIETHAHHLLDRPLTASEIDEATDAAAGLARGFGRLELPEIARLARHLQRSFKGETLEATTSVHLAATIEDLRDLLGTAVEQREQLQSGDGPVLAIGPLSEELDIVLWVLAGRGMNVRHDITHLTIDDEPPIAVIVSIEHALDASTKSMLRAALESFRVPFLALHHDATPDTLMNLSSVCTTVMPRSSAPESIARELIRQRAAFAAPRRALLLGEVEGADTLRHHGFEVSAYDRDTACQADAFQADALVIGADVDSREALRITRLVRADPATRRRSIVWLGRRSAQTARHAARLDVDVAPTIDDLVVTRLTARGAANARDVATDSLDARATLSWNEATILMDRMLVAAHRSSATVSVATIRLDDSITGEHLKRFVEILGVEFRREDVVASRGERWFVVALHNVGRRVATHRMTGLLGRLALDNDQVRVGIAEFPLDGGSADDLAASADQALARSRDNGGPPVARTDWRPDTQSTADVLIIDHDPTVAAMLAAGLEADGHRVARLTNGREALELLSGSRLDQLPRLLLVDLDLHGLSGLNLLRALQPNGVLAQVKAVAMTANSVESDIRTALDLGACDVIDKPISMTLLRHRVAVLLGS